MRDPDDAKPGTVAAVGRLGTHFGLAAGGHASGSFFRVVQCNPSSCGRNNRRTPGCDCDVRCYLWCGVVTFLLRFTPALLCVGLTGADGTRVSRRLQVDATSLRSSRWGH